MQLINGLTSNPKQQIPVILADGTTLNIGLAFFSMQSGWFFTSLNWNNGQWVENGRRVVSHPNMLRQYRNIIPFGLACFTTGNREPTQQQDFSSGASALYILSASEVLDFEVWLQGRKNA